MDIQVEQIEVLTLGDGRSSSRLHRQPFRWVSGDARRKADGTRLTYLVDLGDTTGAPGRRGRRGRDRPRHGLLGRRPLLRQGHRGQAGGQRRRSRHLRRHARASAASATTAWPTSSTPAGCPPPFFDAVAGPGSGETVLAFSVTFIYVGPDGRPTDVDRDGYLDTAANEIYYNDGFSWLLAGGNGMDLETVALHEIGHSLGIGHVGPPLEAAMNPVYAGIERELHPLDRAALCGVWTRWPN